MSTALWIGAGALIVLLVLFAAWRLRRASSTVDRILTEERERPVEADEGDDLPARPHSGDGKPASPN